MSWISNAWGGVKDLAGDIWDEVGDVLGGDLQDIKDRDAAAREAYEKEKAKQQGKDTVDLSTVGGAAGAAGSAIAGMSLTTLVVIGAGVYLITRKG